MALIQELVESSAPVRDKWADDDNLIGCEDEDGDGAGKACRMGLPIFVSFFSRTQNNKNRCEHALKLIRPFHKKPRNA
jgi:hypothetical protein